MPVEKGTITGNAIGGFRGLLVLHSIKIYLETDGKIQSTRAATPGNMRKWATQYTGKAYPRSRKGLVQAFNDLSKLAEGKSLDELGETEIVNKEMGGVAADLAEDGR